MDKNFITDEFITLIKDIIKQENKASKANTEFVYDGVVSLNDNNEQVIEIKGVKYPASEIKNYSGSDISEGSIVRVYAKGDKINNAYIGVVFDNNNTTNQETV